MNVRELMEKRAQLIGQARAMIDKAEVEKRDLTADESVAYEKLMVEARDLKAKIDRLQGLEAEEAELNRSAGRQSSADPNIGLTGQEVQRYSLLRAINAAIRNDWRGAEFEREASEAVAKQLSKTPQGFFVPGDVLSRSGLVRERVRDPHVGWQYRVSDLTKAGDGVNLIATDLLSGSFIDMLRNRMVVQRAGARVLADLVGNIAIPKQTGGATAYWVGEDGAPTKSGQALDQVEMAPKTIGAYTEISRKLLKQSSIDAELFVRDDLNMALALAIDLAALHGTGAGNQPTGIALTSGIGSVVGGADGANPNWSNVIDLETAIAAANADIGNVSYITNAKVRGKLKTTARVPGTDSVLIWGDDPNAPLNGYAAWVTNQVRSDMTKGASVGVCSGIFYGNWADLLIGLWGTLDILVNPYALDTTGAVRVTAFQDVDIAPRHAESFAAMLDATTA